MFAITQIKKFTALVIVLCLIVLTFTGCGKGGDFGTNGPSEQQPTVSDRALENENTKDALISTQQQISVNVIDKYVIVRLTFGNIVRIDLDGKNEKTLIDLSQNIFDFYATKEKIYYSVVINDAPWTAEFWIADITGQNRRKIGDFAVMSLNRFGNYIYFLKANSEGESANLLRMNLNGGNQEKVSDIQIGQRNYWVEDDFAYITSTSNENYRVSLTDFVCEQIAEKSNVYTKYRMQWEKSMLIEGWNFIASRGVINGNGETFDVSEYCQLYLDVPEYRINRCGHFALNVV